MLAADGPLAALGAWRARGGASSARRDRRHRLDGKTSTKDLIAAMIAPAPATPPTRENFNTEIGLPLKVLAAPDGTEVLVLEMAMRGAGQIAELAEIAEPDVGVITNVGPVHLELLGTIEASPRPRRSSSRHARRAGPASSPPTSRCSSRTCAPPRASPSARAATCGARR